MLWPNSFKVILSPVKFTPALPDCSSSFPERNAHLDWARLPQARKLKSLIFERFVKLSSLDFFFFIFFKDNSLKEWSYKKAVTIQTYESYNPIHAPLNIISEFFLLHWWNKKKEERQRSQRKQRASSQPHSSRVKLVILTLYHNFACKMLQMLSRNDLYN